MAKIDISDTVETDEAGKTTAAPDPAQPAPADLVQPASNGAAPADPDDSTPPDVVLDRNGFVRCHIPDPDTGEIRRFMLRRPFLGAMEKLRLRLEAIGYEHEQWTVDMEAHSEDRIAKQAKLDADRDAEKITPGKYRAESSKLRIADRKEAAEFVSRTDASRVEWWTLVFETLCVDTPKVPAEWPGWVADRQLPQRVLQHWRSVPLAPGR